MNKLVNLSDSLEIPRIIIGLWQIADMERQNGNLDPEQTAKFMQPYVKAGFTTFDMADHYGSSEIIAGTFKSNYPDSQAVKLFTKWVPQPGKISREDVRKAIETALDRMKLPALDLIQFHAWRYSDSAWLDALYYLKELRDEGLIQHLGVTNFDAAHLRIALSSGIPVVSNQVSHSVLDLRAQRSMKQVCDKYGVKILAYGTLAGGFLTDKWYGKPEPSQQDLTTWSEMKYKRFIDAAGGWAAYQRLLHALKLVAEKHKTSIATIAGRHVLENKHVGALIVGARLGESEHIQDHKKLLDIKLDAEDLILISEAQGKLEPIPGDCGDEYRKPPYLTAAGDLSHHINSIPPVYKSIKNGSDRQQVYSGTVWESYAGYSRAVKKGNVIFVSGTTATHGIKLIGQDDPAAQTHFVIDKIEAAIESLGGTLKDVVRTRIFVHNLDDWEPVARAHGERFKGIDPANTLVEARLVGKGYLVEIEAEAVLNPAYKK